MKNKDSHPSYGMVRISKTYGTAHLLGSDVPNSTYYRLTINQSEVYGEYGETRGHPTDHIITIDLTPSQLVELFLNANTLGVLCTISRLNNKGIEFKKRPNRLDEFKNKIESEYKNGEHVAKHSAELQSMIQNSKLSKKAKEEMIRQMSILCGHLKADTAFFAEMFMHSTTAILKDAKAQIVNFVKDSSENIDIDKLISAPSNKDQIIQIDNEENND